MADNIKLVFTFIIVLIVIVGGGLITYDLADNSDDGSKTLTLAIVGFIGLALGYVFNREAATQATRAAQSSSSQGADQAATIPHQ